MSFIVYKTTNLINNRFYIGVHGSGSSSYFGSGRLLKAAIKKYGKENFVRTTLYSDLREEEAYLIESMVVETVDKNPLSYNLEPGGAGNCNLGKTVVKNKIGIHAATFDERSAWSKKTQANLDPLIAFKSRSKAGIAAAAQGKSGFQTCTIEQRKEFAVKANQTKIDNNSYSAFKDPEIQRLNGIKGGKSHLGLKTYNNGIKEYKFKSSDRLNKELTELEFNKFLSDNPKFIKGKVFKEKLANRGKKTYNDGKRNFKFKSLTPDNKELTLKEFQEFLIINNFSAGRLASIK